MLTECGWDDAEVDIASRLGACKRRWDLADGGRLGGGFRSAVFACSAPGGEQVVVKLTPTPEEARLEAAALASWAHTGAAVRLIDADISHGALLLALSMLPTVWEPRMHRADDDWRARPAAGTGFIPGSPPRLLAGSP